MESVLDVYVFVYEGIVNGGSKLGVWMSSFEITCLVYYFVASLVDVASCLYALDVDSHPDVTGCGIGRVKFERLSADREFAFIEGFICMLFELIRYSPFPVSLIFSDFLVHKRDTINRAQRWDLQILGQKRF